MFPYPVPGVSADLRLSLNRHGAFVKCPEMPLPTGLSQVIVDPPTSANITRGIARPTPHDAVSDETNGTFTVIAKLTVCAVGW